MRSRAATAVAWLAAVVVGAGAVAADDSDVVVIRAARVYTGSAVLEPGAVLVQDGLIRAVGADVPAPAGATVIEAAAVTAGLIDAHARVEPTDVTPIAGRAGASPLALMLHTHGTDIPCTCAGVPVCALATAHEDVDPGERCPVCGWSPDGGALASGVLNTATVTESWSEVVPETRQIDAVNLRSRDLDRLAAGGVTTVFVSPDSSAVIGPRGAIIRTGGPVADRVVRAEADITASLGSDPIRVGLGNAPPFRAFLSARTRRPTTRMGVTWVFRKAFYDAGRFRDGVPVTGSDAPRHESLAVLVRVLAGEIPLRIHARQQHDILSALRFAGEFGLTFTLLDATEAHDCLGELLAAKVPVVYGPISLPFRARAAGETREARLTTFADLTAAGIPTALTAQDLRDEDGLARQAMYAMRAGATRDQALAAVTTIPARMLGIDGQAGSVEAGKRADLVVWSGEPFDAASDPVVVLVGGNIVSDRRGR